MSACLRSASSTLEVLRPMQGHSAPPATSTTHQLVAQPRKRKVRLSFRKRSIDVEKGAHCVWRFATTEQGSRAEWHDVQHNGAGLFPRVCCSFVFCWSRATGGVTSKEKRSSAASGVPRVSVQKQENKRGPAARAGDFHLPPMRAWLEQPHGRHHKAPPPPCALTTTSSVAASHVASQRSRP